MLVILGILITGAALWWADLGEIYRHLLNIDLKVVVMGCLLQIITILLINIQWYYLSKELGEKISFGQIFHMNIAGTFTESVTPSVKAGGEVAKIYILNKQGRLPLERATAVVGVQKIISFSAFLILNLISILLLLINFKLNGMFLKILLLSFIILIVIFIIMVFIVIHPNKIQGLLNLFPKKYKWIEKANELIESISISIKEILSHKRVWIKQFLLSLFIWGFFPLKSYTITKGLDISISFISIAIITYLTYMVAMVPMLPGGMGTFEGSMTFLLVPFNISPDKGMTLAIVVRFVTFWFVFIISAIYLGGKYFHSLLWKKS